jgi:hypothetical protein
MSGAIPPLPNTPSWRGTQLKRRDSFTFLIVVVCNADLVLDFVRVVNNPKCLGMRTCGCVYNAFTLRCGPDDCILM